MSKYRSPTFNELVGADDATLYTSAKFCTDCKLFDTFVTAALADAKADNPDIPASVAILFVGVICPATVLIFVVFAPAADMLVALAATVDTSDALGTNLTNV